MEKHHSKNAPMEQRKSGCFIATATYGSPFDQNVIYLREFRDEILLKSTFGRIVIKFYYYLSPSIAEIIKKSSFLKLVTRYFVLSPLVRILRKLFSKQNKTRIRL